ncbi:site-specific integrase [Mycobacterium sp. E3198]|uniref:tyrosine-type recombinase/integrase n=1 Tax=Mycobacterium sp. E3198 TaxID=1834143 RepID=UPI0007FEE831|nr:site-specific integrase [Mycobacterium sp. E3198]OBG25429.1 integrase [Mycobacterium sp. E3198]
MTRAKRGFAQIRQERSGRYSVRYTTLSGKREFAGKTFARKADAEAWAADKRRQIDRGAVATHSKITFEDYATNWLAGRHVAGRPIKPRTRAHYQALLDDHLVPEFGDRQLAKIAPADVREWHAATLADKPTLRSHAYSLLRTIFASALNDELIDANPCRIVGAGRTNRVHKIKPASVDELAALTEAMPERLRLMVTLASWCALRFGETIELRRGDIDLSAEVIRIRRAVVRVKQNDDTEGAAKYRFEVGDPKSEAGIRDVAIPPHIIPAIEDHLAKHVGKKRDSLLFPAGDTGTKKISTSSGDQHLQPSTLMRHWYKARAKAGRDDLRWHDLRHSGAVLAAATGASLAELMARLGHSTPTAAMRYQHAAQGRDREIAALLSKLAANK